MGIADDLNATGYFPRELPPPFTSKPFASILNKLKASIPKSFGSKEPYTLGHYSLAKAGLVRRQLALVNPIPFSQLTLAIDSDWANLQAKARSAFSQSYPVVDATGKRALTAAVRGRRLLAQRVYNRRRSRYLVQADVSDFYHSIYTHAVPWALHTKAIAKTNRSSVLIGNRLDEWIRASQDGQTRGIPVGPDTSFLLAEILLSTVDSRLSQKRRRFSALRVSDDYEIATATLSKAEFILAELQTFLSDFELELNPLKTRITLLPVPFEENWVRPIRAHPIRASRSGQPRDLLSFVDTVNGLAADHRDKHVTAFAVGRLRKAGLLKLSWRFVQDVLAQWVLADASSLNEVIAILTERQAAGWRVSKDLWSEVLKEIILEHVPVRHDSEAAWAVWGSIGLGIKLSRTATKALCGSDSPIVALLTLDANSQGLTDTSAMTASRWASLMTDTELNTENWLLAYEANVKGWLPPSQGKDYVAAHPSFGFLKTNGVYFYDQTAKVSYAAWLANIQTLPTFGSY